MSGSLIRAALAKPERVGTVQVNAAAIEHSPERFGLSRGRPPMWRCEYGHPLARELRRRYSPTADNYAVTLPAFRLIHGYDGVRVLVAEDWIGQRHLTHEVAGHGIQCAIMGPASYGATYGWHVVALGRKPADHMMEREAVRRESAYLATVVRSVTWTPQPGHWRLVYVG